MNSRIGYKKLETIDYTLTSGYRTAFVYLYEESRMSSTKAMKRALSLHVSCRQFSYARVAPAIMLGVSGTLHALSHAERSVLAKYDIQRQKYLPSATVRRISCGNPGNRGRSVIIEKDPDRYHQVVAQETKAKVDAGRAVIVFFRNESDLRKFVATRYFKHMKNANQLTVSMTKEDRTYVIKQAATYKQVTVTAAFGRGTDSKIWTPNLKIKDLYVIQAFLSEEKFEDIQIQGRTARQGKKGSFGMILLEKDLVEGFHVRPADLAGIGPKERYEWLDQKRVAVHDAKITKVTDRVNEAATRDTESHVFFYALRRGASTDAQRLLERMYAARRKVRKNLRHARMICLSDATGSMDSVWKTTIKSINEMLHRIDDVGEGHFELKWIAYLDYSGGPDKLLEQSPWTKNPKDFYAFVSSIVCDGGGDHPEAVEVALGAAKNHHSPANPVNRILLIADAPPHAEVKGQPLAEHGNRIMTTDYMAEARQLRAKGVPVYTFRLNDNQGLCEAFDAIARETNGAAAKLDVNTGAKQLIDVVCTNILEDIGGSDLVAEYQARFG